MIISRLLVVAVVFLWSPLAFAQTDPATNTRKGIVQCDGSTTNCVNGLISSIGSAASIAVGKTNIVGDTPNGLLYDNGGVLGNLATGNSGVLVTNGSGVPSISSTLPSGLAIASPVLSGTATGTYTLGGTITAPSLNSVNFSYGLVGSGGNTAAPGTLYAVGDGITITGGTATLQATLAVTDIEAISGTVAAGGSGGTNGACTVTATTGLGTKAQFAGTVSGNALTGALTVAVAGDYTTNPTGIASGVVPNEPVTGCGLSGAQVAMTMGALKYQTTTNGIYSIPPSGTISQGSSTGSGTGATFNTLSFGELVAGLQYATLSNGQGNLFLNAGLTYPGFSGTESTFVGYSAGSGIRGGNFNTALGLNACGVGGTGTSGGSMLCFGTDTGRNVASGAARDVIVGTGSAENISGTDDVIIGSQAATLNLTSATQSVLLGSGVAPSVVNSNGDVIIGFKADNVVGTSGNSVIIGGNQTGGASGARGPNNSVVVGAASGNGNLTGFALTFLGSTIGTTTCTNGHRLIFIGTDGNVTCGGGSDSNAIVVGTQSSLTSGGSNTINIEGVWKATGTGTPSTSATTIGGTLSVSGMANSTAAQTGSVCFSSGSSPAGLLTYDNTNTCLVSSERFKHGIQPLTGALSEIMAMAPVSFAYNDNEAEGEQLGLIAEQVAKIDPRLVANDNDGRPLKVRYLNAIAVLVAAMQDQQREVEALRRYVGVGK
jgi:hypothetical protein